MPRTPAKPQTHLWNDVFISEYLLKYMCIIYIYIIYTWQFFVAFWIVKWLSFKGFSWPPRIGDQVWSGFESPGCPAGQVAIPISGLESWKNPPLKSDKFAQLCTWKLIVWKLEFPTVLLYSKLLETGLYFYCVFAVLFQGVYHVFSDSHPDSIFVGSPAKNSQVKPPYRGVMWWKSKHQVKLPNFFKHTHLINQRKHSFPSSPQFFPTRSTNDDQGAPELLDDFFGGKKWHQINRGQQFFWAPDPAAHPVASLRACDSEISQVVVKKTDDDEENPMKHVAYKKSIWCLYI